MAHVKAVSQAPIVFDVCFFVEKCSAVRFQRCVREAKWQATLVDGWYKHPQGTLLQHHVHSAFSCFFSEVLAHSDGSSVSSA